MKHLVFIVLGIVAMLAGLWFQEAGLIVNPASWVLYGVVWGVLGAWVLGAKWGELKRREAIREGALNVIGKHGYRAHLYLPAVGRLEDRNLANALNSLAASGHIITDSTGALVGKVATARLTPEELAKERRAGFRLVKTEG